MNQYFSMFTTPQAGDIFISWALIHDLSCWERIMRMKTKHWKRVTWLWRWAENWLKLSPNMKLRTITWGGLRPDDGTLLFPKTTTFPWFHISICYWRLLLSLFELRKQNYNILSVRLILRLKMLKGGIHVRATPSMHVQKNTIFSFRTLNDCWTNYRPSFYEEDCIMFYIWCCN